jgi:hypothetical protein
MTEELSVTKLDKINRRFGRLSVQRNRIMFKMRDEVVNYACQYIKQYEDEGNRKHSLLSDVMGVTHFFVFQTMCEEAFDRNLLQIQNELISLINSRLYKTGVRTLKVTDGEDWYAKKPQVWIVTIN